jgi:hypothetical protein
MSIQPGYREQDGRDMVKVSDFLQGIAGGHLAAVHLTPWYNPSRYTKKATRAFFALEEWQQTIIGLVFVGGAVLLGIFLFFRTLVDEPNPILKKEK